MKPPHRRIAAGGSENHPAISRRRMILAVQEHRKIPGSVRRSRPGDDEASKTSVDIAFRNAPESASGPVRRRRANKQRLPPARRSMRTSARHGRKHPERCARHRLEKPIPLREQASFPAAPFFNRTSPNASHGRTPSAIQPPERGQDKRPSGNPAESPWARTETLPCIAAEQCCIGKPPGRFQAESNYRRRFPPGVQRQDRSRPLQTVPSGRQC